MPKFKNFTEKSLLILETKPLCSEEYKFVQIKDLGKKMKEKGILWQDKQFEAIINECLKVMSKVYHEGYYGLEEVIVGSNGRVYMYGKLKKAR